MISDSAKTILCYGDSNTWGQNPANDSRYPRSIRWPSVLQRLLGDDYEVISEGLRGRTLVVENPSKPHRTGITHLRALLDSSDPIDLVIIMLGTNDVKNTYNLEAGQIAEHLEQTIKFIRNEELDLEKIPEILVICPPPVIEPISNDLDERMKRGVELFKRLPSLFKKVADKYSCGYINAGDIINSSKVDGYHLDESGHLKLAETIKTWIQNMA